MKMKNYLTSKFLKSFSPTHSPDHNLSNTNSQMKLARKLLACAVSDDLGLALKELQEEFGPGIIEILKQSIIKGDIDYTEYEDPRYLAKIMLREENVKNVHSLLRKYVTVSSSVN